MFGLHGCAQLLARVLLSPAVSWPEQELEQSLGKVAVMAFFPLALPARPGSRAVSDPPGSPLCTWSRVKDNPEAKCSSEPT